MKIVKVIVDELPESASCCKYVVNLSQMYMVDKWGWKVTCKFSENYANPCMYNEDYISKRCPGCPLEEAQA